MLWTDLLQTLPLATVKGKAAKVDAENLKAMRGRLAGLDAAAAGADTATLGATVETAGCQTSGDEVIVPTISMFYGILVSMFFEEGERHSLPHIHVR